MHWKWFYLHVSLIIFHPVCRVCLHQFQYMGKRYIARYCGGFSFKYYVLFCMTWIWMCGHCHLWWLAVGILINSHEDSWQVFGLLPSNLFASFAYSPSVSFFSCMSLGKILLCGLLLHFLPCFQILPHVLFLLSSFPPLPLPLDVSSGSFLLPQLFLFPCLTFKGLF